MFNDLQIQAKKRFEEIFNRLTGVTPTRTGIIEFSISEVLNTQEKLIESVAGCSKKGFPYIYALSISEDNQLIMGKVAADVRPPRKQMKADRSFQRAVSTQTAVP